MEKKVRYAVVNQDGISMIVVDTRAEADKIAKEMSGYHRSMYSVRESIQ